MTDTTAPNASRRRWSALLVLLFVGALIPASTHDRGQNAAASEPADSASVVGDVPTAKVLKAPAFGDTDSPAPRDLANLVGADSYFVPISPFRMYDSRNSGLRWVSGEAMPIESLSDEFGNPMLPFETTAVAFNVTVAQTSSAGYVQIYGPGTDAFTTSSVNWSFGGVSIANSGVAMLGDYQGFAGFLGVALGGLPDASAHIILDITGYYMPF